jgi:hypothetical protein
MPTQDRPPSLLPGTVLRCTDGLDSDALPLGLAADQGDEAVAVGDGAESDRQDKLAVWGRFVGVRLAWLGLAALIALGSAGVVAAVQHSPSGGDRPELTYGSDSALADLLDGSIRDLTLLNDDVTATGDAARAARSSLTQIDAAGLTTALAAGDSASASVQQRAADLDARLQCEPWDAAREAELGKTHSPAMIERYRAVCAALQSIGPISPDWDALVVDSQVSMSVLQAILDHDRLAGEALALASGGRYPEALAKLDEASAALARAKETGDTLAKVTDVSTLTELLRRTKRMDDALRLLWQSMVESNGRITAQVTAALKAVSDAKAALPDDNSALQVVVYELAGQVTADAISIETAKGRLGEALNDLVEGPVYGR